MFYSNCNSNTILIAIRSILIIIIWAAVVDCLAVGPHHRLFVHSFIQRRAVLNRNGELRWMDVIQAEDASVPKSLTISENKTKIKKEKNLKR